MKLEFIALDRLAVSKANMRHARKVPDVSDILPTVRMRGVLQPILVRETREPGHYEIVAGRRRFHAARIVAAERAAASAAASAADARIDAGSDDPAQVEPTDAARPHIPCGPTPADPDMGTAPGAQPSAAPITLAPEAAISDMLACAVLDEADDAAAIEASLIENIARLDPDEVSRWECFTRLVREGRSPEQIGQTFGLPDLAVRRVLALGNLLPRIRDLYRREEIDAVTIRHLTLASKSQQKAWLALIDDPDAWVPRGHQLKNWLFGGQSIPVRHALFDAATSGLAIVTDLFGEDPLFVEADAFWALQNAAIETCRAQYLEAGWPDVIILDPSTHFHGWEHEKTPKRKGGRVYIDVRANGEVVMHEGYLSSKEAARLARRAEAQAGAGDGPGAGGTGPTRPELSSTTRGYVDLHRHAAVRAGLLDHPGVALRLLVAHAIAGSPLWRVGIEPQSTKNDAVRESVTESRAEALFDTRRRAALALLDCDPEDATVVGGTGWGLPQRDLPAVFTQLAGMGDAEVLDLVAIVMGETLGAGTRAVESAGHAIGLAMSDWWEPDDAFFEGLRDREVLLAMLAEVAGSDIAAANAREKGATIKTIIRDHLAGNNGRVQRGKWVPRWMAFPPADYTARGIYASGTDSEGAVDANAAQGGADRAGADQDPDDTAEPGVPIADPVIPVPLIPGPVICDPAISGPAICEPDEADPDSESDGDGEEEDEGVGVGEDSASPQAAPDEPGDPSGDGGGNTPTGEPRLAA